jgi:hypothetical protein
MTRFRTFVCLACLLSSCAHVHSFHQEPFDTSINGTPIVYEVEHTVWFRFDSNTDWLEEARDRFVAQCSSGQVKGVSSRLSTMNSFLHWNYHFRMAGTCVR